MNELIPVIQNLSIQIALDEVENALQEGVERLLIRPDDADSDLSALQEVLTIDFRDAVLGATMDLTVANDRIKVKIPEGVAEGQRIRVSRKGDTAIQILVHVKPHPFYERRGGEAEAVRDPPWLGAGSSIIRVIIEHIHITKLL